jgi:hypothetical protein
MMTTNKQLWIEKQPHETYAQALLRVSKTAKNGAGDYFLLDAHMIDDLTKLGVRWNHVCGWWEQTIGGYDGIILPISRIELSYILSKQLKQTFLYRIWETADAGGVVKKWYEMAWMASRVEIVERGLRALETPFPTEITVNDPLDGIWYFKEHPPADPSQDYLKWLRRKVVEGDFMSSENALVHLMAADALLLLKHDGCFRWNHARGEKGDWEMYVRGKWAPCAREVVRLYTIRLLNNYYQFQQTRAETTIAKHPRLLEHEKDVLIKLHALAEYVSGEIYRDKFSHPIISLLRPRDIETPISVREAMDDSWSDTDDADRP